MKNIHSQNRLHGSCLAKQELQILELSFENIVKLSSILAYLTKEIVMLLLMDLAFTN